ncbi:MAG: M1 family aminopeptidase [Planctomycetota bacterium]|jgi:hypothetical protein
MAAVVLLILQSAPVVYGQELLHRYQTYDIERCEVRVVPLRAAVRIHCDLRVKIRHGGPLHFLLSRQVDALSVTSEGRKVGVTSAGGALGGVLKLLAPNVEGVPRILVLRTDPPVRAGETVRFRMEYLWRPGRGGMAYAHGERIQTHLTSFWIPTMADQRFDGQIDVKTSAQVVASGEAEKTDDGWRFRTTEPAQVLSLVTGRFVVHRRGALELYAPAGLEIDAASILADLKSVLGNLEKRFGARPEKSFRVVIDPDPRPAPSYCGGNFVVLHRTALPTALDRTRWLSHLAHECSHRWWGHRVATPVIGGGGTWLREGLAQWSGVRVAGDLLGEKEEQRLWRAHVGAYLGTLDLRRTDEGLFGNEPTLADATPIDHPRVAYWRGALVLRALEQRVWREPFAEHLRFLVRQSEGKILRMDEFAKVVGAREAVAYYAETSRLPDFVLDDVDASGRARVRCLDARWPDTDVPCRVETDAGVQTVAAKMENGQAELRWTGTAKRIDVDPERILLDPIRSNNVWPK